MIILMSLKNKLMGLIVLMLLSFSLSSCSSLQDLSFDKLKSQLSGKLEETETAEQAEVDRTKMLLRIEERDLAADITTEYRFLANKTLMITVLHLGDANQNKLYSTLLVPFADSVLEKLNGYLTKLDALKYDNDFPWKEKLEVKGNTVEIEFAKTILLNCFDKKLKGDDKNCKKAKMPKTYLYYTGHTNEPAVFAELLNFAKQL